MKRKKPPQIKVPAGVPADEYYLAAALQNAHAKGLGWTRGAAFRDASGKTLIGAVGAPKGTVSCCALGALMISPDTAHLNVWPVIGNDSERPHWSDARGDEGESLGFAFRCALGSTDVAP